MTDSRIAELRTVMQGEKIDAFLIPHGENYYGDYNAPYVKGLEYMMGFTGSQGLGVVTAKSAHLLVDGRYTIQSKQETKGTKIICGTLSHSATTEILINDKVTVLGLDLSGFCESEFRELQVFCEGAKIKIKPLSPNPIESLWEAPIVPSSPAYELDLQHAGVSSMDKRAAICKTLKTLGAEASLISSADSIAWLLNIRGDDVPCFPVCLSWGILMADGKFLWFVDEKKTASLNLQDTEILPPSQLTETLKGLKISAIHLDPNSVSAEIFATCRAADITIIEARDLCQLPKACKNPAEVAGTRTAHEWDGVALCEFLHWFSHEAPKGNLTEISASDELWEWRAKNPHCKGRSFETISATAANGAICHYRADPANDQPIKDGDIYLVDSGGQYFEGTTDITRTVAVGNAPSATVKSRFTRVLQGHIAIATARFPAGISGGKLDSLARAPLWREGLDYAHGTGHGVGSFLGVHEGPQNIGAATNTTPLQPGMIVSNEPGYYKEGEFGIRIENLVLVCDSGDKGEDNKPIYEFETLSLAPIDPHMIDVALLTEAEKDWLNRYHAQVFETLSPHLQAETVAWLQAVTAAI